MSLTDTLGWLIDIPSETGNEGRICTQVAARMLATYREQGVTRVNNSLVVGERSDRPLVLLVGHLDTVPSQGQGPARVEDGRMHGLGASDMKSGLAVMIHLLESEAVRLGPHDVVGVLYEAEEGPMAGNGLEPVLQRLGWLTEADLAVVMEPSDAEVQVGCNGVVNARVTFQGRSAHSARPWLGVNAITRAGEWLAALDSAEPEIVRIGDLEFREVLSVTTASGGIASNVIPATFALNLNYRFSPRRTVEEAIQHVKAVCDKADEVEIVDAAPAGPVVLDHPLVERLRVVSGAGPTGKQGWTDVARLGAYGVAAVNYGPGETAQAHRADESVALANLDRTYAALHEVLAGEPHVEQQTPR